MKKFIEYDSNMVSNQLAVDDVKYFDIRQEPFDVYGFYDYRNTAIFQRLPEDIAKNTNHGVSMCHLESAGGRIRFSTDSKYITLKAEFNIVGSNSRTPQLAIAGFDLYIDTDYESRYYRPFIPPYDVSKSYETYVEFPDKKLRYITINFPYHTSVENVYIGIDTDASLGHGLPYKNEKPVIFYGSSITHGSCASRPGMIYENILSRRLNMNYTNLGFGGSAGGEEVIAKYMADLDMCMFVSDYDYNSHDEHTLSDSHKRLYEIIREKNPTIPYLMISKPDFEYRRESSYKRREVIFDTYKYACSIGDENVYYIDGESIFRGRDWDNCFVDTIHPNDVGFLKMADAVEPVISKALSCKKNNDI